MSEREFRRSTFILDSCGFLTNIKSFVSIDEWEFQSRIIYARILPRIHSKKPKVTDMLSRLMPQHRIRLVDERAASFSSRLKIDWRD